MPLRPFPIHRIDDKLRPQRSAPDRLEARRAPYHQLHPPLLRHGVVVLVVFGSKRAFVAAAVLQFWADEKNSQNRPCARNVAIR
jgi:hypothetical protein